MQTNTKNKKTYYVIYKGKQVGIFHGERKYLEKITKRDHTSLHKCLRSEHKAIMYWHLHSNEIPTINDVIDDPASSDRYIIVKRDGVPGLW
jgi:hypothetical protein